MFDKIKKKNTKKNRYKTMRRIVIMPLRRARQQTRIILGTTHTCWCEWDLINKTDRFRGCKTDNSGWQINFPQVTKTTKQTISQVVGATSQVCGILLLLLPGMFPSSASSVRMTQRNQDLFLYTPLTISRFLQVLLCIYIYIAYRDPSPSQYYPSFWKGP